MNSAIGNAEEIVFGFGVDTLPAIAAGPLPSRTVLNRQPEAGEDGLGVAEGRVELLRPAGILRQVGQGRQRQFVADAGIVDGERGGEDAVAADGVGESGRKRESGRGADERAGDDS